MQKKYTKQLIALSNKNLNINAKVANSLDLENEAKRDIVARSLYLVAHANALNSFVRMRCPYFIFTHIVN